MLRGRDIWHLLLIGDPQRSVSTWTHSVVTVDVWDVFLPCGPWGPLTGGSPPCRHSLAQDTSGAEASTSPHPFSDPGNKKGKNLGTP